MEIDFTTDPWINKRVFKLFLPAEKEHPKDAIARRIDILMEARCEPDGHKLILEGGDEYNNCTKKDIIKLMDKTMYLISALTIALHDFPKKTWRDCCDEASKQCSIFTTPYSGQTIEEWWTIFCVSNSFPHPRGLEASLKPSHAPPIL